MRHLASLLMLLGVALCIALSSAHDVKEEEVVTEGLAVDKQNSGENQPNRGEKEMDRSSVDHHQQEKEKKKEQESSLPEEKKEHQHGQREESAGTRRRHHRHHRRHHHRHHSKGKDEEENSESSHSRARRAASPQQRGSNSGGNGGMYSSSSSSDNKYIMPTTKWCGAGNRASAYNDSGTSHEADACCREHDHCPLTIRRYETLHGFRNTRPHTVSSCECDDEFYMCLKRADEKVATHVGTLYFNILKVGCFLVSKENVCTKKRWGIFCVEQGIRDTVTMYAPNNF